MVPSHVVNGVLSTDHMGFRSSWTFDEKALLGFLLESECCLNKDQRWEPEDHEEF